MVFGSFLKSLQESKKISSPQSRVVISAEPLNFRLKSMNDSARSPSATSSSALFNTVSVAIFDIILPAASAPPMQFALLGTAALACRDAPPPAARQAVNMFEAESAAPRPEDKNRRRCDVFKRRQCVDTHQQRVSGTLAKLMALGTSKGVRSHFSSFLVDHQVDALRLWASTSCA